MQVWELMKALSEMPAGADIYGSQDPNEVRTHIDRVYLESEGDGSGPDFVVIDLQDATE